jgi:hypothetical protein
LSHALVARTRLSPRTHLSPGTHLSSRAQRGIWVLARTTDIAAREQDIANTTETEKAE